MNEILIYSILYITWVLSQTIYYAQVVYNQNFSDDSRQNTGVISVNCQVSKIKE